MSQSIHIVENPEEHSETEDQLYGSVFLSPEQAEGELVCFEMPGTMGKRVYRIVDVDLEAKETLLEEVLSGNQSVAGDSMLPPQYNHFTRPKIGYEESISWLEHMNGRGEWVRTTPKRDFMGSPVNYYGKYKGHEKVRVVTQSYKYMPPGVEEYVIWIDGDDLVVHSDTDLKGVDIVKKQVDVPEGTSHGSVGELYAKHDGTVIDYNIDMVYRSDHYQSAVITMNDQYINPP